MHQADREQRWLLVYTKARAESWADLNLRKQGFTTLLPRVRRRDGFVPLFPRYIFVGASPETDFRPVGSTSGILYVVHCGGKAAHVPLEVIEGVRGRMDEYGVVELERRPLAPPLFARRERERVQALVKFARAGFRVVA